MSDAQGQVFDYTLNHSWDEAMKAFGINSSNVMRHDAQDRAKTLLGAMIQRRD